MHVCEQLATSSLVKVFWIPYFLCELFTLLLVVYKGFGYMEERRRTRFKESEIFIILVKESIIYFFV